MGVVLKKFLKILAGLVAVVVLGLAAFVAWALYPQVNPQPLPSALVALSSPEGIKRRENANFLADLESLSDSFQAQSLASYCGVASSVSVLAALGTETSQGEFFTDEASKVRSQFNVIFGGMSLPELAGLLGAYELRVSVRHADQFTLDEFRDVAKSNLSTTGDYLLVNYQREELGQGRVGHISPVAAYDRASDSVLVMDTAAHKYPPTWVPVDLLYAAMRTTDPSSGKMRGFVEVSLSNLGSGWGRGIRTPVGGVRVRSPTTRRSPMNLSLLTG
jgi:hypothetical protein